MDSHPRPDATILLDGVALAESDKQRPLPQEMADETLRRTREIADEAVRQRTLLHQCLRDCDAVDRSILVEPWTLTAALYPGARWAGGSDEDRVAMIPFTPTGKVATIGGLLGLLAVAAWPRRR